MDLNSIFNTPDYTDQYDPSDIENNKIWSGLAYLGGGLLFFLPIVISPFSKYTGQGSPFGKYHANQALVLLIFSLIAGVFSGLIGFIPVVGRIIAWVIRVICFVLMVVGLINGFQGKAKSLPVIGELFSLIK